MTELIIGLIVGTAVGGGVGFLGGIIAAFGVEAKAKREREQATFDEANQ